MSFDWKMPLFCPPPIDAHEWTLIENCETVIEIETGALEVGLMPQNKIISNTNSCFAYVNHGGLNTWHNIIFLSFR